MTTTSSSSSTLTATATVLGFGARTPSTILRLLSKAVLEEKLVETIHVDRSRAMPLALCQAPYRVFLQNDKDSSMTKNTKSSNLLLYCLPTSVTEYLAASQEAARVRTLLLSGMNHAAATDFDPDAASTVVAVYDVATDRILLHGGGGGSGDQEQQKEAASAVVYQALRGDAASRQSLAMAALHALSNLDEKVLQQCSAATTATTSTARAGIGQDVVIVVGAGGREHALAVALAKSPLIAKVIVAPGNGGTAQEETSISGGSGGCKIVNATNSSQDNVSILALCKEHAPHVKMVVVGPEQPLVDGLVDALAKEYPHILAFGPTQAAAQLEASKAFAKDFLQEHNIPTAKYKTFTNVTEAIAYVESLDESDRQVVKASGLAAGKGVLLPTSKKETIQAVHEIMSDRAFGAAGDTCVIESFLTGPEASCLAFCDGKTAKLMPAAQDHKRALDNDMGLNTGGMGAYAPAPCVTPLLQETIEKMCITTVKKMAQRGTPYVGVLYAGMMLTPDGPYVLEFNCRFGDPETQVVLPLLETDLYEIMTACCQGKLDTIDVRFRENTSAATVVCAAKGYPETYPKEMEITGLSAVSALDSRNIKVYHAGTKLDDRGVTRCSGGRVLAVTGLGPTLKAALRMAYNGVRQLDFIDQEISPSSLMHHRTDIGRSAVEKKLRIGVLGSTRGTALIPVMEACASGRLHAEIVAIVSNKSAAPILEKGRSSGEKTVLSKFISAKGLTRAQYDAECTAALVSAGVEFVLLVGYMRILSKPFTDYWRGRCINVHPSLLPKHAGGMDLQVHQAVIDANEKESGCTIHEVTEVVDGGKIVVQKRVQVDDGETAESLKAKVQALEGPAFIEAIEKFSKQNQVISYADAGVDIVAGDNLVDLIKPLCRATRRPGCDADLGGFGGLFDLAAAGYDSSNTILIGATDGVGTKLRIAHATGKHESVGIDLVAMCVNDLVVAGGEPLFFLDYFATGHLEVNEAAAVVKGIAKGCEQAGCGLIGGETAEMPSMYAPGDYDLAGFSVGAVQRDCVLPKGVQKGDAVLGLASSGIHSNGFSLVRKLIEKEGLTYDSPCPWESKSSPCTVGDSLLTPTKIYVKACLPLVKNGLVKAMAHITGGGLLENLPRSLPDGVAANITAHPPLPPVFKWLQQSSGLDDSEMLRTFNCGIGMILLVSQSNVSAAKELLLANGETTVYDLGVLTEGNKEVNVQGRLS